MIGDGKANVVLVHGLWMHSVALLMQRYWLTRHGFDVGTFSYSTVRRGLGENGLALSHRISEIAGNTIHLVGHSLGGMVILNMLANNPDNRISRVVLMGSPCLGSHCASTLLRLPALAPIVGRSIRDSVACNEWKFPAHIEIGVISGSRSIGLGRLIRGLPRPNDGVVALEETRLVGSRDAITLPVSHSEMLFSKSCANQVAAFLNTGCFLHA